MYKKFLLLLNILFISCSVNIKSEEARQIAPDPAQYIKNLITKYTSKTEHFSSSLSKYLLEEDIKQIGMTEQTSNVWVREYITNHNNSLYKIGVSLIKTDKHFQATSDNINYTNIIADIQSSHDKRKRSEEVIYHWLDGKYQLDSKHKVYRMGHPSKPISLPEFTLYRQDIARDCSAASAEN